MSNDSDNKYLCQKFIKLLERNKDAAKFFVEHISHYSKVLDINFIERQTNNLCWLSLSRNDSLPWSESFIDRYNQQSLKFYVGKNYCKDFIQTSEYITFLLQPELPIAIFARLYEVFAIITANVEFQRLMIVTIDKLLMIE